MIKLNKLENKKKKKYISKLKNWLKKVGIRAKVVRDNDFEW